MRLTEDQNLMIDFLELQFAFLQMLTHDPSHLSTALSILEGECIWWENW